MGYEKVIKCTYVVGYCTFFWHLLGELEIFKFVLSDGMETTERQSVYRSVFQGFPLYKHNTPVRKKNKKYK